MPDDENILIPPEIEESTRARNETIFSSTKFSEHVRGEDFNNLAGRFPSPNSGFITDLRQQKSEHVVLPISNKTLATELEDDTSELRRTMRANGIFTPADMKMNEAFYRFPRADPYNYVDGAREYLFFTKPDLPLLKSGSQLIDPADKVPFFNYLMQSEGYRKSVFWNLCASKSEDDCPFMRILSNRKSSNMDLPDLQVEELETAVNMFGSKILYPKSSGASDEGVDFTVEFEDTRFAEIYNLWKTYDLYRRLKWEGLLGPTIHLGRSDIDKTGYDTYAQYTYYKILYDHFSVYKFLVETDGFTILYGAKATGVYARSINRSAFSEIPDKGPLKINIGFKISGWLDDDLMSVVTDFNNLVLRWQRQEDNKDYKQVLADNIAPLYDHEIGFVSQELVGVPFIILDDRKDSSSSEDGYVGRDSQFKMFKLVWTKSDYPKKKSSS